MVDATADLPTLEDLETGEISVCKACDSQMIDEGYCEECHEATDFRNETVYFAKDVKDMLKVHPAAYDRKWKEFPDELGLKYACDAVLGLLSKELKKDLEAVK